MDPELIKYSSVKSLLECSFLIRRMLRNTIDNAANYAKTKVMVQVRKHSARDINIIVEDDGPGMTEEAIDGYGQKKPTRMITKTPSADISLGLGSVYHKAHSPQTIR